jgi:phage terminase large subunit
VSLLDVGQDTLEGANATRVVIPYIPREHFKRLHESTKRWKFVVAHRRAGKSVAEINETIKKALTNTRAFPPPRYAYVGPSFAQTKDLIWGYLKHYTSVLVPHGCKYSEGDLECTLPNGAKITLYGGAAAYERMRGLYFDGIVLDEFPLLNPSVFSTVVRPCLADYRGWAIVSGTSNGDDHFHELKKKNQSDPTWEFLIIPVTETDALHPDEVSEMTKDMSPEEYAREMLCRFDAPIEGAYYADLMNQAEAAGRICGVPYDPAASVFTWWDLGIDDFMSIWFMQKCGGELHAIDYDEFTGLGIPDALKRVDGSWVDPKDGAKPFQHRNQYRYGAHVPPHDIKARELGTGKSRYEVMVGLLPENQPVFISPSLSVEDGIGAVKITIPLVYFDKEKTEQGRSALRNYHRSKKGQPVHNWASHGSDAFRTGSVALNHVMGFVSSSNIASFGKALRRKIRGIM